MLPSGDQTGIEYFSHRKIKTITPSGEKQDATVFQKILDLSADNVMFYMLSQGDVTTVESEQNTFIPSFLSLDKLKITDQDIEITINDSSTSYSRKLTHLKL